MNSWTGTEGWEVEPGPLYKVCHHCHDRYPPEDEDDERRYRHLCLGCAEMFRGLDQDDELVQAHEERPSHLL